VSVLPSDLSTTQTRGPFRTHTFLLGPASRSSLRILVLNAIPLRIVHFRIAEQSGLRFELHAVAND